MEFAKQGMNPDELAIISKEVVIAFAVSDTHTLLDYICKNGEDPDEIMKQNQQILISLHEGSIEKAQAPHIYSYSNGFRGFAARLTSEQASLLAEMPGVVTVFPNEMRRLHTTRSWDFLGLQTDEETEIPGFSTKNQDNVIVGFIDTGLQGH